MAAYKQKMSHHATSVQFFKITIEVFSLKTDEVEDQRISKSSITLFELPQVDHQDLSSLLNIVDILV